MKCERCGVEAPTVIAYGTKVFVCCGFPLVNTDRTLRLRDHIEHGRLSEEARVRRYQDRIVELELRLAKLERIAAKSHELDEREERIATLRDMLRANGRTQTVALLVTLLKEMADVHTRKENLAVAIEGGRCPVPGHVALAYHALADALRWGLDVSRRDLMWAFLAASPHEEHEDAGGEGTPTIQRVEHGGADSVERAGGEADTTDDAPETSLRGTSVAHGPDWERFWHDQSE